MTDHSDDMLRPCMNTTVLSFLYFNDREVLQSPADRKILLIFFCIWPHLTSNDMTDNDNDQVHSFIRFLTPKGLVKRPHFFRQMHNFRGSLFTGDHFADFCFICSVTQRDLCWPMVLKTFLGMLWEYMNATLSSILFYYDPLVQFNDLKSNQATNFPEKKLTFDLIWPQITWPKIVMTKHMASLDSWTPTT